MNIGQQFELKWDARMGPVLIVNFGKRQIGLTFCHRMKERSYTIRGHTLPLCARCTGMTFGFALFLGLSCFRLTLPSLVAAVMTFPLLVDGFSQFFGFRKSNNYLRLASGILFSFGFMYLMAGFL